MQTVERLDISNNHVLCGNIIESRKHQIPELLFNSDKKGRKNMLYPGAIASEFLNLWYLPDQKFFQPKTNVTIFFWCPNALNSFGKIYSTICMDIFVNIVTLSLNTYSYLAELAELEFSLKCRSGGLELRMAGFDDKMLDLALLKADLRNTKYIPFSKSKPEKLQRIIAAGYPFGKYISDDLKFTSGIVSSLKGPNDDSTLIQVDAALNVGNSGGPIVDEDTGQLVAVSVMGMDKSIAEGQNFGIKTSSVKNFLNANKVKIPFSFNFARDVANNLEKSTLYVYCN